MFQCIMYHIVFTIIVKSSFFSELLKYATKIYQDMMILFDHA